MNYNKVILMGNLTRDPELRYLPSNTPVVEFGLAVNRKWKKDGETQEETCFVDCTAFGRSGEVINQFVSKGKPLMIEGRLQLDQWEDKQSGQKRSKLKVIVENFQFVGGRDGGEQTNRQPQQRMDHSAGMDGDDIPFSPDGWDGQAW
jgi:single-strand DNA-binding protein